MSQQPRENEISGIVLKSAIEAHKALGGPGLLESLYEEALAWELERAGLQVNRQVKVSVPYKGEVLRGQLVIDLLIEGLVIVEVKSQENYHKIAEAQVLTYLRITGLRLGLVINFGEARLVDGFNRVVNGLK